MRIFYVYSTKEFLVGKEETTKYKDFCAETEFMLENDDESLIHTA
jgi:hypothetical protein